MIPGVDVDIPSLINERIKEEESTKIVQSSNKYIMKLLDKFNGRLVKLYHIKKQKGRLKGGDYKELLTLYSEIINFREEVVRYLWCDRKVVFKRYNKIKTSCLLLFKNDIKLKGGAGGNKMINNKVKNKGNGGNSKINKPVQPPKLTKEEQEKIEAINKKNLESNFPTFVDWLEDYKTKDSNNYTETEYQTIYDRDKEMCVHYVEKMGNKIQSKSQHDENNSDDEGNQETGGSVKYNPETGKMEHKYRVDIVYKQSDAIFGLSDFNEDFSNHINRHDQRAAPFCGYAAIGIASGLSKTSDIIDYPLRLMLREKINDPYDIGTPEYLNDYCATLGYNLIIIKRGINPAMGVPFPYIDGYYYLTDVNNLPLDTDRYIVIEHIGDIDHGHYILITKKQASINFHSDFKPYELKIRNWLFSFFREYKIVNNRNVLKMENYDYRKANSRRAEKEINDKIIHLLREDGIAINRFTLLTIETIILLGCFYLMPLGWFTHLLIIPLLRKIIIIYFSEENHFKLVYNRELIQISEAHFQTLEAEIQLGKFDDATTLKLLNNDYINSPLTNNLLKNTAQYAKDRNLNDNQNNGPIGLDVNTIRNLVQYNVPSSDNTLEDKTKNVIINNQISSIVEENKRGRLIGQ